jgi:hypothetical protein
MPLGHAEPSDQRQDSSKATFASAAMPGPRERGGFGSSQGLLLVALEDSPGVVVGAQTAPAPAPVLTCVRRPGSG